MKVSGCPFRTVPRCVRDFAVRFSLRSRMPSSCPGSTSKQVQWQSVLEISKRLRLGESYQPSCQRRMHTDTGNSRCRCVLREVGSNCRLQPIPSPAGQSREESFAEATPIAAPCCCISVQSLGIRCRNFAEHVHRSASPLVVVQIDADAMHRAFGQRR